MKKAKMYIDGKFVGDVEGVSFGPSKEQLEAREAYVFDRSSRGVNTPISKLELENLREEYPGGRFTVVNDFPNRRQRRAHMQGKQFNNRYLTKGRVMARYKDPMNRGQIQPAKATKVDLFDRVGNVAYKIMRETKIFIARLKAMQAANAANA